MLARLASSSASFSQKVTDVASPLVRSTHRCPWSNPGRTAMDGTFTSLKIAMHSSIFSGLTWIVTTRASIAPLLLPVPLPAGLVLASLALLALLTFAPWAPRRRVAKRGGRLTLWHLRVQLRTHHHTLLLVRVGPSPDEDGRRLAAIDRHMRHSRRKVQVVTGVGDVPML